MDAAAYLVSFDKEQMALLCANYDRRIDSLGADNKRLKAENAKLRELVQRMWPVFIGEKRATFTDRLHVRAEIDELGIEVGE